MHFTSSIYLIGIHALILMVLNLPSSGEKLTSNVFSAPDTQHPLNLMWLRNQSQLSPFPTFVSFAQETVF